VAPPPLLFIAGLGVGLLASRLLPLSRPPQRVRRGVGLPLIASGLGLVVWAGATMHGAGTAVQPTKPSVALVTDGPYRFTRNPAYLGMALLSAGIAFLADAPWALLPLGLVLLVIDRGVIAREERYLDGLFGDEYSAYRRRVRRWI
jgi:protein-S-isoprenylcysteine O-methyltransferase Ste14